MALFSRKKTKSKKASKEEEAKSSADTSTANPAKQATTKGRNGTQSSQRTVQDIPLPANPQRQYDSGYDSGVLGPGMHSRSPSMPQFRRDDDSLLSEEHLTPDNTGFQGRDHLVQDGRYQRQMQKRMPMRPSSVPSQALQSRTERVSRPKLPRSSSPGPVLPKSSSMISSCLDSSAPANARQPSDWLGSMPPSRGVQLQSPPAQLRPPTFPLTNVSPVDFGQDKDQSPLWMLSGLKVNKCGLILDEEGDPIAELYEGDIIDCVRQRSDGYGNVHDEYGRIVGRVRTLSSAAHEPILRPFTPRVNDKKKLQYDFPNPPLPPTASPMELQDAHDEEQQLPEAIAQLPARITDQMETSPTRTNALPRGLHDSIKHDGTLTANTHDHLPGNDTLQQKDSEQAIEHHESHTPRYSTVANPVQRKQSLPSVPESDGSVEILLSDSTSHTSEETHAAGTERDSSLADETSSKEQPVDQSDNAQRLQKTNLHHQEPTMASQVSSGADNQVFITSRPENKGERPACVETAAQVRKATTAPPLSRSISQPVPTSTGMAPVLAVPKTSLVPKKPAVLSDSDISAPLHAKSVTLHATPSRVKSPPLPSFPSRGFGGGMPESNANANTQMPGMPVRRLTTPGFPSSPAFGTAGVSMYSPPGKPRNSNSTPLRRSPLSSHGMLPSSLDLVHENLTNVPCSETTPPESERGSVLGDIKAIQQPYSLTTGNTASQGNGAVKPRKVFAHAAKAVGEKDADVVVKEIGGDKKQEKKKKGMKGLFGRKK